MEGALCYYLSMKRKEELLDLTNKELREYAKENDIDLGNASNKSQIVGAILIAQTHSDDAPTPGTHERYQVEDPRKSDDDGSHTADDDGFAQASNDDDEDTVVENDEDGTAAEKEENVPDAPTNEKTPSDDDLVVVKYTGNGGSYILGGGIKFTKASPFAVIERKRWEEISSDRDLEESSKEEAEDFFG